MPQSAKQRMRSTKLGAEAGREWAGDTAEADDLQRLERWKARVGWEWEQCFDEDANRSCTVADLVAESVWPDDDIDGSPGEQFWERALGDNTSEPRRTHHS